jgi:hypothetical protein
MIKWISNGEYYSYGITSRNVIDINNMFHPKNVKWIITDNSSLFNAHVHNECGPAVEFNDGSLAWLQGGEFHREDGPAIEYADGRTFWFIKGIQIL